MGLIHTSGAITGTETLYPVTMILGNHGKGSFSGFVVVARVGNPASNPGPGCSKGLAIASRGIHFSLDNAIASTALGPVESCIDGSDYRLSLMM
jgi:hypothetical protein